MNLFNNWAKAKYTPQDRIDYSKSNSEELSRYSTSPFDFRITDWFEWTKEPKETE